MKDCKKIHPLLSLYQENELSPREKFGRLHDVLKGQPEPPLPSDLHGKIMARVRGNVIPLRSSPSFWTKATWTLATAAVMAFLFINQVTDWGEFRRGPSQGARDESASGKSSRRESEVKAPANAPQPFAQAPAQAKKKQMASQSFSGNLRSDDNEANRNFAETMADKDTKARRPAESAAAPSASQAAKVVRAKAPAKATLAGADIAGAPAAPAPESRLNEMDQLAKKAEVKEAPADRAALPPSAGYSAGLKTLKISQEKLAQSWSGDNDTSPYEREDVLDSVESFNEAWKTFHPGEDPPGVDFTKNAVVLLLAGQKPTSGYSIHVTHLEENEDQVYIWYQVHSPAPETVATQMITHPWTLQIIPKPSKPVVFQKE